MESLVSIAKRLGIHPNPNMTSEQRDEILKKIYQEIRRRFPPQKQPKDYKTVEWRDIQQKYYDLHKVVERPITNLGQFQKNYDIYEHPEPWVELHTQDGAFRWHDARIPGEQGHERFVADIQLDSPYFPKMIRQLDAFILKHRAGFKIPMRNRLGARSDTLNLYLPKEITPSIAREFVSIIRPCLSEKFDGYLNGSPLTEEGRIIRGVRIGPEYKHQETEAGLLLLHSMQAKLQKDISNTRFVDLIKPLVWKSSLGEKASALATLDLLYYLSGKEGQNPFQLLDYNGQLYHKGLETVVVQSRGSVFQDILSQISSIKKQMHICRTDMNRLALEQKQIRERLKN